MNNKPIIALDFPSEAEVFQFLNQFDEQLFVKVGMELYMQEGPDIVRKIKAQGHDIFLDLKLHDIPNTVKSAMKGLARLGVDLVNVHAAGGFNRDNNRDNRQGGDNRNKGGVIISQGNVGGRGFNARPGQKPNMGGGKGYAESAIPENNDRRRDKASGKERDSRSKKDQLYEDDEIVPRPSCF